MNEILELLPHRYPFLLVDKIIESSDTEITALKAVTINEPFFQGHFPQKPIMPGVLILEALAQTSGLLVARKLRAEDNTQENKLPIFAGIDNVKFKQLVEPGDVLMLHSEILKNKRDIWKFTVAAKVNDNIACSAELTCAFKHFEHDSQK